MAFYETEKTEGTHPSDLAKSLVQYRKKHDLSRDELAEKLQGVTRKTSISANQIKGWELGRAEPSASAILTLADKLNVSCDHLLRGCPSELAGVHSLTGLSGGAVESLFSIHQAHDAAPAIHAHLLPLLDMLLTDKLFLEELEAKVWRLVHLKAEQNAYSYEDETEINDLTDSIEYKLSRMFVEQIRKYVDSVVPAESDAIRRKDLEEMAEEVRRSQKK